MLKESVYNLRYMLIAACIGGFGVSVVDGMLVTPEEISRDTKLLTNVQGHISDTSSEDSVKAEGSHDLSGSSEDLNDIEVAESAYDKYCEGGFYVWKADAERFFKPDFIAEFNRTGIAPKVQDGRIEFGDFIECTLGGNVFLVDWDSGSRSAAGKLIQNMLDQYSERLVCKKN